MLGQQDNTFIASEQTEPPPKIRLNRPDQRNVFNTRYDKQVSGEAARWMDLADCTSDEARLKALAAASADFAEGRQAFMEKQQPRFTVT